MRRYQLPIYKFCYDGEWRVINEKVLIELEKQNKEEYDYWDNVIYEYQQNPIAFFLPHGVANSVHGNDGRALLNDWTNDLLLLTAPNQTGKSALGTAFVILHGLIPHDPEWQVFKKHGVKYCEWTGPKIAIVASWSWDNTVELWKAYRHWLPRTELGRYAEFYGQFESE